jgi:MFS family permease
MRQTSRLSLYLTQFHSGIIWVTLGPLLNSILNDLGIPLAKGGLPAFGFNLGTVLGLLVINFLLARVPAKRILVGAACVEAVSLAASGLLADIRGRENLRLRRLKEVVSFNPALLTAIVAAAFMYLAAESTLVVWLPKFQIDVFGATETWAGLSVTLYWVRQIVARVVSVGLTRRFRASSLLLAGSVVMAVFAGVVAVSPGQALFLMFTLGAGLGSSACFSYIASYAGRFPGWHAGVAYSALQLAGGLGAMVFSYLTGPLAASLGFRVAIAVAAAPALTMAMLAIALRRASGGEGIRAERVEA